MVKVLEMLWTQKHKPRKLAEVAGNEPAKEEVKKWALDWERNKVQKPLLLWGPTGIGKTALVEALALEVGWDLIETNASDLRDAETIQKLYGLSSASKGLFGEKRLILIDEIDSAFDRGEIPAITKILKESGQPVIIIANDVWSQKLAGLRTSCKLIEMKGVNARTVTDVLQKIAVKEKNSECGFAAEIAKNNKGDLRGAINDLQACVVGAVEGNVVPSARDREESVFEAVRHVLKTMIYGEAVKAADNLDEDLETFIKWLEENIPAEYEKSEEIAEAFDWLSRGDVFRGRIYRRQYYDLLLYVRALSLAGVALSKKETYRKFTPYKFPSIIRELGASKKNRGLLDSIASKVGSKTHVSKKDAKEVALPFMPLSKAAKEYYGLDDEETAFIKELFKS
ncbi:replication factor C large subunit [Candidatus Micrarchaeota archaeon]|nr:replication factor C large subunit [Candidatus Micrarchaeota archaeon]